MGDACDRVDGPHADRHRVQGHAGRRRRATRSAPHVVGRGGRAASGLDTGADRRRHPGRVPLRRWRHRPLRRHRGRARARRRAGPQPALRVGPGRGVHGARRSIKAGMDRVVVAGGVESALDRAAVHPPGPGHRRLDRLGAAQPPETPDAPERGHVDHGRVERRRPGRRDPRGDGRLGVPLAPAGHRGHRRRRVRRRDRPDRGHPPRRHDGHVRGRRAPAPGLDLEKLASLKPIHPEIEGFSITAGNASGVQRRRRRRSSSPTGRWPRPQGCEPLA